MAAISHDPTLSEISGLLDIDTRGCGRSSLLRAILHLPNPSLHAGYCEGPILVLRRTCGRQGVPCGTTFYSQPIITDPQTNTAPPVLSVCLDDRRGLI